MKKFFLCIVIALFVVTAFGILPARDAIVYAQKGGDKGKDKERKDPPGPPIVRDKERPKNPPKDKPKDRKPPDR